MPSYSERKRYDGFKTARVGSVSERDQRVMAVMYLNPDGIVDESGRGNAMKKLGSFMAVPYSAPRVRDSIYRLEALGYLMRDLQPMKGQPVNNHGKEFARCKAVYLAVERDGLPLDMQYVDELRVVIQKRMESAAIRAKVGEPQPASQRFVSPKKKVEQPEPTGSIAEQIADALLAKVIERAKGVDSPDLLKTIQSLQSEVAALTTRLSVADRNTEVLIQNTKELADENERLKNAAENVAGRAKRGEWLTSSIKELVGDDVWKNIK